VPEERAESKHACFEELIEPLESRSGKRLTGPWRATCMQACQEDPDGFARCAADALSRGRFPLALLMQMIRAGEHRLSPPPREKSRREAEEERTRRRFAQMRARDEELAQAGPEEQARAAGSAAYVKSLHFDGEPVQLEELLEVVSNQPQKVGDLARAVGRDPNDRAVQDALNQLHGNQKVERVEGGWVRADARPAQSDEWTPPSSREGSAL
jgi:hypothetical protein